MHETLAGLSPLEARVLAAVRAVLPGQTPYADLLIGLYADEPEAERVLESVFRRGLSTRP